MGPPYAPAMSVAEYVVRANAERGQAQSIFDTLLNEKGETISGAGWRSRGKQVVDVPCMRWSP